MQYIFKTSFSTCFLTHLLVFFWQEQASHIGTILFAFLFYLDIPASRLIQILDFCFALPYVYWLSWMTIKSRWKVWNSVIIVSIFLLFSSSCLTLNMFHRKKWPKNSAFLCNFSGSGCGLDGKTIHTVPIGHCLLRRKPNL